MLAPSVGQFPNVANVTRASFSPWVLRMKDRRLGRCWVCRAILRVRNECEFFYFDSDEEVCLSLGSVVSGLVVAFCDKSVGGQLSPTWQDTTVGAGTREQLRGCDAATSLLHATAVKKG